MSATTTIPRYFSGPDPDDVVISVFRFGALRDLAFHPIGPSSEELAPTRPGPHILPSVRVAPRHAGSGPNNTGCTRCPSAPKSWRRASR